MFSFRKLLFAGGLIAAMNAYAGSAVVDTPPPPAHEYKGKNCWIDTAKTYRLDPYLLYAIANVESGLSTTATNINVNGSMDMGVMQINSMHYPMLQRYGFKLEDLEKPCNSIRIGAWILALNIQKYGYNWRGIGAYNAGSDSKRATYFNAVSAMYDRLKSWSAYYTSTYTKEHGHAPAYVIKMPKDWQTPSTWKGTQAKESTVVKSTKKTS